LTILDDETVQPYDETYTYNKLGNLTSKTGKGSYSYPATGSAHPHAVTSTSDGQTYAYDANGNMTGTGGLISLYDAENRPTQLRRISGTEDYTYDADSERLTRTFGFTTTLYLGGIRGKNYPRTSGRRTSITDVEALLFTGLLIALALNLRNNLVHRHRLEELLALLGIVPIPGCKLVHKARCIDHAHFSTEQAYGRYGNLSERRRSDGHAQPHWARPNGDTILIARATRTAAASAPPATPARAAPRRAP
jgi:YD repeat-containing protein